MDGLDAKKMLPLYLEQMDNLQISAGPSEVQL